MVRSIIIFLSVSASSVLALGCSSTMATQVIRYSAEELHELPTPACEVSLVESHLDVPEHCTAIGDVFVGDTGWSIDCGKDRVLRDIRAELCKLGADLASVRKLDDGHSTCYQARAIAYRCSEQGAGVR